MGRIELSETDGAVEKRWWLVAAVAAAKPGSNADVQVIREMSDNAELEGLRDANNLLKRLAQQPAYNELVAIYEDVHATLAATQGMSPPPVARVVSDLNRLALALGGAAATLCVEAVDRVRGDFGDDGEELALVEAAVQEVSSRAPFRLLQTMGEQDRGCFTEVEGDVGNDVAALAALRETLPGLPDDIDLVSAMESVVVTAQVVVARQLQQYEERITNAMRLLRTVGAEALEGPPGLMLSDLDLSKGRADMSSMSFEPFALDEGVGLLRALRQSRTLLAATQQRSANEVEGPEAPAGSQSSTDSDTEPQSKVKEASAEADDAATRTGADGPPSETNPSPSDYVADLEALVDHVLELSNDLERAWSAALTPVTLMPALSDLEARIHTLLRTYQRRISASTEAVRDEGFNTLLPAYPLPASEYNNISFDPEPARAWLQLQAAIVDALLQVARYLAPIRSPVPRRVSSDGDVEGWWASGAFDLIRGSIQSLHRLVRASESVDAVLVQGADQHEADHLVVARLELMTAAVSRGDFEAALIHAEFALRARAAALVQPVPDDLLDRVAGDPRLGDSAVLVRLLAEAASRRRRGDPLDVGATAVVAPPVARLVHSLCAGQSEIIQTAAVSSTETGPTE